MFPCACPCLAAVSITSGEIVISALAVFSDNKKVENTILLKGYKISFLQELFILNFYQLELSAVSWSKDWTLKPGIQSLEKTR
jgi:hypothetical protein